MISTKYKNIYDQFIEHYKNIHVNPWHEINEYQLQQLYSRLVDSMNVDNEYSFKYFMDYIIKRLSGADDAHTRYDSWSLIPMNFRIFNDKILVNYPDELKTSKLLSINGISINTIIKELEEVITYGTIGKRNYEIEKSLFNRQILFGLPSLRNCNELVYEIETPNGERILRIFDKSRVFSQEELFDYEMYEFGKNASYSFIGNCLVYKHSSVQMKFQKMIEESINNLRNEDLSSIDTIIIDIRGNTGGNSALNKILMDFIEEHSAKKLICLTDYRVFSAGRYALRDLIDLGAITIGEEISTPINCYGNSNCININGHNFSISECYFNPFIRLSASSKKQFQERITSENLLPYIFKPDILIEETESDFVQGIDVILDYATQYSKLKKVKRK